jgi:signal transduction histidine kinase/ligand-binding sensor domain-containing protein
MGKKIVFFFLAFLFGLFFIKPLYGERLPVKIYTSADGLGSSFVDSMFRDSRGFMWFCTRDGLSRFDGARFVTYQVSAKDSPPGIEGIYETRSGTYFVVTTGGTYRFNPNDISPPDAVLPRLNAEFVTSGRGQFFEDSRGTLWFASSGLYRVRESGDKVIFDRYNLALPSNLSISPGFGDLTETADGSLWMNSNVGVIRLLPDERTVYYPSETILNAGNTALMADKSGNIWLTRNNQLLVIKPEPLESFSAAGQVTVKPIAPTVTFELKPEENYLLPQKDGEIIQFTSQKSDSFIEHSYSKKIFQTSDGNIWVTAENYLLQLSSGIFHLHTEKEGLPTVMARMEEDAAGNLWIGGHAGLGRIDRSGLVTYSTADGANSARFFAINEGADGTLYFAAFNFFLNRFDGTKLQAIRPQIPLESNFLWSSRFAYLDSGGGWWFLTGNKLYYFTGISNFEELKNKPPTKIYTTDDGLKSNGIFQIFESTKGDIWVSTRDDDDTGTATARLKKGEEKFHVFTEDEGLPKGKSFSAAVEDSAGNIWFSFYSGGLARFDGERFKFFGKDDGLPVGVLPDLHIDKKGRLWIGSAIGGLMRLDDLSAENPSFTYITTADGLSSNNIRTITEDNFGRIYLGSARGVDRLSPETGKIKHYSVNDGLAADFVIDSHCDRHGDLWFVTNDGVSRLTPLPEENTSAPRIFLGGLRIAGEQQPIPQIGSMEINKGELSANQNNLQIDFFGLDFRAGETLRYQYKLEGADEDWSLPSEQRTRTFANLSPGTYRFLVRAVNSENIASETPAVISFKILSPIWQRWWFILFSALLVTGVIILLYRYRISNLSALNAALMEAKRAEEKLRKSKEERLAELEKVRSRIAIDLHDDIGASLTQIAVLSEVAQAQSKGNGATDSLTKISNVSNELVEAMSDIVWSINPSKDHLSDLTQRMRRFASDILSAKGVSFHFHAPEASSEIIVNTNLRREVFLIFKESVNNVAKHSAAKHVEIDLKIENGKLSLTIADDGVGLSASNGNGNSMDYGGNGILSIKKRAAEMNGKVEITSADGNGTTVKLALPLEHFSIL